MHRPSGATSVFNKLWNSRLYLALWLSKRTSLLQGSKAIIVVAERSAQHLGSMFAEEGCGDGIDRRR